MSGEPGGQTLFLVSWIHRLQHTECVCVRLTTGAESSGSAQRAGFPSEPRTSSWLALWVSEEGSKKSLREVLVQNKLHHKLSRHKYLEWTGRGGRTLDSVYTRSPGWREHLTWVWPGHRFLAEGVQKVLDEESSWHNHSPGGRVGSDTCELFRHLDTESFQRSARVNEHTQSSFKRNSTRLLGGIWR